MATRGWGKARTPNTFVDPAPTKGKPLSGKAGFTDQKLVSPKVHHTATSAINKPSTYRAPWQKLG